MLESLFNKVAGLQDRFYFSLAKTLKNFINFLTNYVKCKVMLTEAYLEPSRTSTMELFSLRLSHILKTYLIRSNCLLRSIFYKTHSFVEKTFNSENFGRKSFLLTIKHFFFSKFEITQCKVSSIKVF